jgi:acetyl esterase/lipase
LRYGPDARNKLDLYQPNNPAIAPICANNFSRSLRYFFLWVGSWVSSGDRASYRFVAKTLAAKGILVIVADYRLYPRVRYRIS